MAKQIILTSEGLQLLQDELENLKTVRRKENTEAIKRSLSFGDLSENSEYDEAKNEQAEIEARIVEIEGMLKNVKIIDEESIGTDVITVGSKVKVLDAESGDTDEYLIIGSTEADPTRGRISDESPVGAALLGHKTDDVVYVDAPMGKIEYKVISISK